MDTQLKSHVYYEYFRSYFAGATDSLKDRIDDLKSISHGGAVDESFLHELLENSTEEVRLEKLGDLFRKQLCEYHWALELYRKALEIYKKILGEDHLDVANTYNNIANVMESHGKLEDAMELYRKALKIKKKTLGEEHSDGKALEIYKKTLGAEHPDVSMTYNNIANVMESHGKLEDAMELYRKALKIKKKTLGEEHSDGKALEIYKKTLREEHPDVSMTYNNIANVMESHGKLEDAMELYRKALKIKKKTLGEEHWSVASTSNNMANVESQSKEEKEEFQAGSYDSMILMQTSMSMETRKQVTGIYSATMISSARKEQRKGTCLEVSLKGAAAKHDRPPIASRPILQRRYP
jgi:tetratricopeptide (TPR) repeat protein